MPLRSARPLHALSRSIAMALAGLVVGCGGGGGAVADFVEACMASTNMERALCECVAEKAEAELSAGSFDLLVAMLEKDEETTTRLRGELPLDETLAAGMFMVRGPAECAESRPAQ